MKKLNYFWVLLFLGLTISSCETPYEPASNSSSDDIVGTWNTSAITLTTDSEQTINGFVTLNTHMEYIGFNINQQLTFNSDNTYNLTGTYDMHAAYHVVTTYSDPSIPPTEQDIQDDVLDFAAPQAGTWSLNGSTLNLNDGTSTSEMTVTELTANSLKIEGDYLQNVTVPGQASQVILVHAVIEYTR